MKQENKELLLKDLCARLPFGVKCNINYNQCVKELTVDILSAFNDISITPYLRPMLSMTDEEYEMYHELIGGMFGTGILINLPILEDFLNKNMFDYRGLIPMGLALEAPEGMYNIKEK